MHEITRTGGPRRKEGHAQALSHLASDKFSLGLTSILIKNLNEGMTGVM